MNTDDFIKRHPGLKGKEITRVSAYGDILHGHKCTLGEFEEELPKYKDETFGTEVPDHKKVFVALDIDATQLDKEIVLAAIEKVEYNMLDGKFNLMDFGIQLRKELGL